MNHWACRAEISSRCHGFAVHGEMPPHATVSTMSSLRINPRIAPNHIQYAPFQRGIYQPPPTEAPLRSVVSESVAAAMNKPRVRASMRSLSTELTGILRGVLHETATFQVLCDVYWLVLVENLVCDDLRMENDEGDRSRSPKTSSSSQASPRHSSDVKALIRSYVTRPSTARSSLQTKTPSRSALPSREHANDQSRTPDNGHRANRGSACDVLIKPRHLAGWTGLRTALEEVFAAACRRHETTLVTEDACFLFAKLGLTSSPQQAASVMKELKSEFLSKLEWDDAHQDLATINRTAPPSPISPRSAAGKPPSFNDDIDDVDAHVTITKRDFMTAFQIAPLSHFRESFLVCHDLEELRRRASANFLTLWSPFRFSLAVRDSLAMPYCNVISEVIVEWIMSSCTISEDERLKERRIHEIDRLVNLVELSVSKALLGLRVTSIETPRAPHRPVSSGSVPPQARNSKGVSPKSAFVFATPSVANISFATTTPGSPTLNIMEPHLDALQQVNNPQAPTLQDVKSAMAKFSKSFRFAHAADSAVPVVASQPDSSPRDVPRADDNIGSAQLHLGASQQSATQVSRWTRRGSFANLTTMLKVTDEEVEREMRGEEANIERTARYIVAHQASSQTGKSGQRSGKPQQSQIVGDSAVSLEAMLREEARPMCVRVSSDADNISHRLTAQLPASTMQAVTIRERLGAIEKKLLAAEALEDEEADGRPARRSTVPLTDITSATSQRTIAKHARRLVQQLEEKSGIEERNLERRCAELARSLNQIERLARVALRNGSAEDEVLYRETVTQLHKEYEVLISTKHFAKLSANSRTAAIRCSVEVGKRFRHLVRTRAIEKPLEE